MGGQPLNAGVVGMAATPDGKGYWLVASDGGIFAFGDARFYGSMGGKPLNAAVVGMAATPDGKGYWRSPPTAGSSPSATPGSTARWAAASQRRLVGIAATPDGNGYWVDAADGGVFAFGDARFYGSMGGRPQRPGHRIAAASAGGYWLIAADGGVFSFGSARFTGP